MQRNLFIASSALMLALSPLAYATRFETPELFKPMPLASFTSAQDETLRAIHRAPAFQMINRVAADATALQEDTGEIVLSLAPGIRSEVKKTHAETLPDGSVVWRGRWNDTAFHTMARDTPNEWNDAANEVILVNRQGRITGSIHANGQRYAVRPLASGGHAIIEVSEAKLPAELPPIEVNHTDLPLAGSAIPQNTATDNIDARVMIVFSDDASKVIADPVGLAQLVVAETNDGYARSGIAHRVQMVDSVYASEYEESGDMSTDLNRLRGTDDGHIDWIHDVRDLQRADLVTLITTYGAACGLGYLKATADLAFTVARDDCATGNYTYSHELGHNYGAAHNPEVSRNKNYPYGHGFQNLSARLRTVMSYNCTGGCSRVNIWSGPNNDWNGNVMGNAHQSDNTRVLNERAATVAGFR